jgi:hypothetical protein
VNQSIEPRKDPKEVATDGTSVSRRRFKRIEGDFGPSCSSILEANGHNDPAGDTQGPVKLLWRGCLSPHTFLRLLVIRMNAFSAR